jgi:hypothetical protein
VLRRLFNIAAATTCPFFGQKNWHPIVWVVVGYAFELNKAKSWTAASGSIGKVVNVYSTASLPSSKAMCRKTTNSRRGMCPRLSRTHLALAKGFE